MTPHNRTTAYSARRRAVSARLRRVGVIETKYAGGARLEIALRDIKDPIAARKIIRECMFLMESRIQSLRIMLRRMSPPMHRRGELPGLYTRTDRVVMARGRWYLVTRERIDIGP